MAQGRWRQMVYVLTRTKWLFNRDGIELSARDCVIGFTIQTFPLLLRCYLHSKYIECIDTGEAHFVSLIKQRRAFAWIQRIFAHHPRRNQPISSSRISSDLAIQYKGILFPSTFALFQRIETRADGGLRERRYLGKSRWKERTEEETQSGVAESPAAGSRGSTVVQFPQDSPTAPEATPAKRISGECGCDRHRLNTFHFVSLSLSLHAVKISNLIQICHCGRAARSFLKEETTWKERKLSIALSLRALKEKSRRGGSRFVDENNRRFFVFFFFLIAKDLSYTTREIRITLACRSDRSSVGKRYIEY